MAKRLEPFDAVAFGPGPADRVIERPQPRRPGELQRIARWVGRHHPAAQLVLALAAVTVCYLAFVFGLLLGVGVRPWVGG